MNTTTWNVVPANTPCICNPCLTSECSSFLGPDVLMYQIPRMLGMWVCLVWDSSKPSIKLCRNRDIATRFLYTVGSTRIPSNSESLIELYTSVRPTVWSRAITHSRRRGGETPHLHHTYIIHIYHSRTYWMKKGRNWSLRLYKITVRKLLMPPFK